MSLELSEEEKRGVSEQLSEEELALFDILTKPEIEMTAKEKEEVKKVARHLLQTLKQAKLVLDWRKKQRSRADVYTTVKTVLDELPRAYTPELYEQKCDRVYQHVYDSYQGEGRSIYALFRLPSEPTLESVIKSRMPSLFMEVTT